jgi:uncharacterized protein
MNDTLDTNFYIFKNNNDIEFVYSGYSGLILEYNPFIGKAIDNSEEVDSETYNYLYEDPFIKVEFPFLKDNAEVDTIEIIIRNNNMQCSCCINETTNLVDNIKMDANKFYKGIIFFLSNFKHNNIINITFHEVEKVDDFYIVEKIVELINTIKKEYEDIRFVYSVMVDEEILYSKKISNFLIKYNFEVVINIGKNSKTNYDDLFTENITIKEISDYLPVKAAITVPYYEVDLTSLCHRLYELGVRGFSLQFPVDHEIVDIERDKYILATNIEKLVYYFISNIGQRKLIRIENFIDILYSIHYGSRKGPRYFPCSAGKSSYALNIKGDIYPCRRFDGMKKSRWDDIDRAFDNDRRREFLSNHMVFTRDSGRCLECWAKYLCGGTCYYSSHKVNHNTSSISEIDCYFNRIMVESALYIYASLKDDERAFLGNIK